MSAKFPALPIFHEWGHAKEGTILFLHANSYSAQLYKGFFDPLLEDYQILAPDLPGHGESRWNGRIETWQELADYFIQWIDKNPPKTPWIGMGHSIGGIIIMLMSLQRPEWFSKLILLDPVMLPKRILWAMRLMRLTSTTHIIPLAQAANRRKTTFPDRQTALDHYASKQVFSRWEPAFKEAYVDTCLHEAASGEWHLTCAPQVESSIYQSIPLNVWSLPGQLQIPTLFLVGKYSDTISPRGRKRLKRSVGNHVVKTVDGGHLFPFEKPTDSMGIIMEYFEWNG